MGKSERRQADYGTRKHRGAPRGRRFISTALVVIAAATGAVGQVGLKPAQAAGPVPVSSTPGDITTIPGFLIQSSSAVGSGGAAVSTPGFSTPGWFPVAARSTVFAGLLANNVYPDPFFSTNMQSAGGDFGSPWWYRADFSLDAATGLNTFVNFSGVISRADVWVNGTQVATNSQVAGAYTDHEFDLTSRVHSGTNTIAFLVYPNDPSRDFTVSWIDWNPTPPDSNMGIFRDVTLRRSPWVALRGAHVLTKVSVPALDKADLTVKVDARNDSSSPVNTTVTGSIGAVSFSQSATLAAHSTQTLTYALASYPQLSFVNPQIWWPAGSGGQPLYDLNMTATVSGALSDGTHERFGIRDLTAPVGSDGIRRYSINGRPLLLRGGGWASDLFLRSEPTVLDNKFRYAVDLGLNAMRLEGHLETPLFYDLADQYGIVLLPGWECCSKWQQDGGWSSADQAIADASMASEAQDLRNHPSVVSFLIGSDAAPSASTEQIYLNALNAADWPNPVIGSANDFSFAPITGPTGLKEPGPYEWIPPVYWYNKQPGGREVGSAWGFNSENGPGPAIPTLDSLNRMLSPGEQATLWQNFGAQQYHAGGGDFTTLQIFDNALAGRYGSPTGLNDYVRKAQLANYEANRAQYEAYARNFTDATLPSTGLIYWQFTSAWSSLHWQFFDAYFDQGGSYFGTKKANEAVHVLYSYDDQSVAIVNRNHTTASGLTVQANVYNIDGTQKFSQTVSGVTVPGEGGNARPLTIPAISGLSTTYLLRLVLTDASGHEVSRNVYWLSTAPDVLDYGASDYRYTPTTSYANLSLLSSMAQTQVTGTVSSVAADGMTTSTVILRNTTSQPVPAFFVDAHVLGNGGAPVLPIQWSDNEVSLWPGESTTLTATYRTIDLSGAIPSVRVSGWNIPPQIIVQPSVPPPAPTVTGVSPVSGTTAGGTPVTISGTNLGGATSVTFGGNAATGVSVNAGGTQISATTPAAATAGSVTVAVTTPGGTGSLAAAYTYTAPPFPIAGGSIFAQDTFAGRSVSGGWGTASDGHAWGLQAGSASVLSVSNNSGRVAGSGSLATLRLTLGTSTALDTEAVDRYTSGAYGSDAGHLMLRFSNASTYYLVGLDSPVSGAELNVMRAGGGSEARVANVAFAATNGTAYWQRARVTTSGTTATILVRVWADGTAEPSTWNLTYTDTAPLPAGSAGVEAWDGGAGWAVDHFTAGKLS